MCVCVCVKLGCLELREMPLMHVMGFPFQMDNLGVILRGLR